MHLNRRGGKRLFYSALIKKIRGMKTILQSTDKEEKGDEDYFTVH